MSPFRRNRLARATRAAGSDPSADAALAGMKPGKAYELRHWHEAGCPRLRGGPCTCPSGPRAELRPFLDPREN